MSRAYYFFIIAWLYLATPNYSWAQIASPEKSKQSIRAFQRMQDSLWMGQLPLLEFPEKYRDKELPAVVDNSLQPYLRPVFSQNPFPNCGQASSIGYAFTYEINRLRDLPSDTSINQYPPDFVWNFMGDVQGGVNYFHTFSVLQKCGTPTVTQYGGFQVDDIQWMSGYEKYLSAMQNRIRKALSIDVSTEEGITKLKHWLVHHMEDSEVGGVAVFAASSPWNTIQLPDGTPEEGKLVSIDWRGASHNMTIVGYHDSIRYDYNGDGRFTNNIDINEDGLINVSDWEIGGVKVVNSYGDHSHDSGFFYATYKSLADPYENVIGKKGGIWNNAVVVMEVKESYEPLLTLKAKIRHPLRQAIKISAGISPDTNYQIPIHKIDFPIFNYQGDDLPMQGFTDTLEFGLDITPLLAYVNNDGYAKVFLLIEENDREDVYDGELLSMSVYNYTKNQVKLSAQSLSKKIVNDGKTYASQAIQIDFRKPEIDQDSMPAYVVDQEYEFAFSASNGTPPYHWSVIHDYIESNQQETFPNNLGDKIPIEDFNGPESGRVAIPLPFTFPFYGEEYDTLWVHVDGFVKFEESDSPWPYFIDKDLQLKSDRMVAPMFTDLIIRDDNGIWYEESENNVLIRWRAEAYFKEQVRESEFNFAVRLWDDGKIEFYYGKIYSTYTESWASGISNGEQSFQLTQQSNTFPIYSDQKVILKPPFIPNKLQINDDGLLSCLPLENRNCSLKLQLSDDNNIIIEKDINFFNSFQFDYQTVIGSLLDENRFAHIDLKVKNRSDKMLENVELKLMLDEAQYELFDSIIYINQLSPFQTIDLDSAFAFSYVPVDNTDFTLTGEILAINDTVLSRADYYFDNKSIDLSVNVAQVEDGNNGKLEPGETAYIVFNIVNHSAQLVENLICELFSKDPYLIILDELVQEFDDVKPYSLQEAKYKVQLNKKAPSDYQIKLNIELTSDFYYKEYPLKLTIESDNLEIAIVYFNDKQLNSSTRLRNQIRNTNYSNAVIYKGLTQIVNNAYSVVMVNLGSYPFNHQLTEEESYPMENYLNSGGNLLLMGGNTFYIDPKRPIHSYFKVEGGYESWLSDLDSLAGVPGTFTENMLYSYYGDPYKIDHLMPLADAFTIIEEPATGYGFAVAYIGDNYKTIGSTVDISAVEGLNENSSDVLLVQKILEFFGMKIQLAANFVSNQNLICKNDQVEFLNTSSTAADEFLWHFHGGIPEFSSELNPVITYSEPGMFDVELIASNNDVSDTLIKAQYIQVEHCSSIDEDQYQSYIYPNPAKHIVNLIYHPSNQEKILFSIVNIHGKVMMTKQLKNVGQIVNETFDLTGLNNGVYFLVIKEKSERSVFKMLVK